MDEKYIAKLAADFRVPPQSVDVLNRELPGNAFYEALEMRSLGVGLDYVLVLAAETSDLAQARKDMSDLMRIFPNRSPNALAGFYLDSMHGVDSDLGDGTFMSKHKVSSLYDHSSDPTIADARKLLGFQYRNSPGREGHLYQHGIETAARFEENRG